MSNLPKSAYADHFMFATCRREASSKQVQKNHLDVGRHGLAGFSNGLGVQINIFPFKHDSFHELQLSKKG